MMRLFIFLSFAYLTAAHVNAQSSFQGTIVYDVRYEGDYTVKAFIDLMPKLSTLHIKDQKTRFDQNIAGGGQQSYIVDNTNGATILLMTLMGQTFQVPMDQQDINKLQPIHEMSFVHTSQTKEIAGYLCSHAYSVIEGDTIDVFFTTEVKAPRTLPAFKAIDGLPLEYAVRQDHMKIFYTCASIVEQTLSDGLFDIASQVKEIPFETFARAFAVLK